MMKNGLHEKEEDRSMAMVLKVLSLVFSALTLCGGIYVISSGGDANPGYAVVPMIISLALASAARSMK